MTMKRMLMIVAKSPMKKMTTINGSITSVPQCQRSSLRTSCRSNLRKSQRPFYHSTCPSRLVPSLRCLHLLIWPPCLIRMPSKCCLAPRIRYSTTSIPRIICSCRNCIVTLSFREPVSVSIPPCFCHRNRFCRVHRISIRNSIITIILPKICRPCFRCLL